MFASSNSNNDHERADDFAPPKRKVFGWRQDVSVGQWLVTALAKISM